MPETVIQIGKAYKGEKMAKFINDPSRLTDDMIEGLAQVHEDYIDIIGRAVVRKGLADEEPKVTAITIGGTGHEPSSLGFSGRGWECVKVLGDIFAAPGPAAIMEGIHLADKGQGILFYIGNHAGDVMNAKLAMRKAKKEGIDIRMVTLNEDISTFGRDERGQRRGMCASLGLGKTIGAACEKGMPLDAVEAVAQKHIDHSATISVAVGGATHPATGKPISTIEEGKMIIGMGQHGEDSGLMMDIKSSRETVGLMADRIVADLELKQGDKVLLIINGSGSTTYMELMTLYKDTVNYLKEKGIEVAEKIVGSYLTTQEQGGFQMSMTKLDEELLEMVQAPCNTYFIRKG